MLTVEQGFQLGLRYLIYCCPYSTLYTSSPCSDC